MCAALKGSLASLRGHVSVVECSDASDANRTFALASSSATSPRRASGGVRSVPTEASRFMSPPDSRCALLGSPASSATIWRMPLRCWGEVGGWGEVTRGERAPEWVKSGFSTAIGHMIERAVAWWPPGRIIATGTPSIQEPFAT